MLHRCRQNRRDVIFLLTKELWSKSVFLLPGLVGTGNQSIVLFIKVLWSSRVALQGRYWLKANLNYQTWLFIWFCLEWDWIICSHIFRVHLKSLKPFVIVGLGAYVFCSLYLGLYINQICRPTYSLLTATYMGWCNLSWLPAHRVLGSQLGLTDCTLFSFTVTLQVEKNHTLKGLSAGFN